MTYSGVACANPFTPQLPATFKGLPSFTSSLGSPSLTTRYQPCFWTISPAGQQPLVLVCKAHWDVAGLASPTVSQPVQFWPWRQSGLEEEGWVRSSKALDSKLFWALWPGPYDFYPLQFVFGEFHAVPVLGPFGLEGCCFWPKDLFSYIFFHR